MKFEISPVTSLIRVFYDESKSSDERDPYDAIVTIQHLNYDVVYLSGLNGSFSRGAFRELLKFLKANGANEVQYERRGQKKSIKLKDF